MRGIPLDRTTAYIDIDMEEVKKNKNETIPYTK